MFLFIEKTREYLCGMQRRGSTMTDEEMAKLIRQIGDNFPPCVKKVIVKGDAEFIGGLTFKVKVVLEALEETMTLAELASKYAVHPNQISNCKKQFLERSVDVFSGSGRDRQEIEQLRSDRASTFF